MNSKIEDETINKIKNKIEKVDKKIDDLRKDKEKDLEQEKLKIDKEYKEKEQPYIEERKEIRNELEEYLNKYKKYSTFKKYDLINVLVTLITIYEGKKYCFQEAYYYNAKPEYLSFSTYDRFKENIDTKISVIVNEKDKKNCYNENDFNLSASHLVKNGKMLILQEEQEIIRNEIVIYTFDNSFLSNKYIYTDVIFGKFTYVKDFIDMVVKYRFDNQKDNITKEEMEEQLKKFVLLRREEIETNYDKKIDKRKKKYMDQICQEQKEFNENLIKLIK